MQTVVGGINDNARVGVVYQKMLSSFVGEQDISGEYFISSQPITTNIHSAQEVCHSLLKCPMWISSRQYCALKVSEGTSDEVTFSLCPNMMTLYQHYTLRPEHLIDVSLYEFYQWYDFRNQKPVKHGGHGAKPYVVDIWPHFIGDPADTETYEQFCHAKVFLHHPH